MFNDQRIQQLQEQVDTFLLEDSLDELFGFGKQKFNLGDKVKVILKNGKAVTKTIRDIQDNMVMLDQSKEKFDAKTGKAHGAHSDFSRIVKEDIEINPKSIKIEEEVYPINRAQYNYLKQVFRQN